MVAIGVLVALHQRPDVLNAAPTENIARGKPVDASSVSDPGYPAAAAMDGQTGPIWQPAGGGPTTSYTDPFGGNARTTPFAGSIKQCVSSTCNAARPILALQAFGADRVYGDATVHAAN